MILNSRQNGFLINLPQDFFNAEVQTRYDKYYRNLLLPYKSISDFMASTIQGVNFPGLTTVLPTQTRTLGKIQEVQSAKPIADMFTRELKLTFKLTDAYLNYFIFLDNALPMLGKYMDDALFNKIYDNAKSVTIILDGDAWDNTEKLYHKLNYIRKIIHWVV